MFLALIKLFHFSLVYGIFKREREGKVYKLKYIALLLLAYTHVSIWHEIL